MRRFEYDALNRPLTEKWFADASAPSPTDIFGFSYDVGSRLLAASGGAAQYVYSYDTNDRLLGENVTLPAGVVQLTNSYPEQLNAQRDSLSVAIGGVLDTTTAFNYDGNLRLASMSQTIGASASGSAKYVGFLYGDDGRLQGLSRYAAASADPTKLVATSAYAYDDANRLTGLVHAQGANVLAAYGWSYDPLSRVTEGTSPDGTVAYAYDPASQLIAADYDYLEESGATDEEFEYDDAGNWMANGFPVPIANRPLSDGTYSYLYDNEGNRTRKTLNATGDYLVYRWDHRQRLVGIDSHNISGGLLGTVDYAYDYLDRLVTRSTGAGSGAAEHYVYDGDDLILRLDGAGEVLDRYLWAEGIDQLLADEQFPGQTAEALLWALLDQRGTALDLAEYDAATNTTDIVMHRVYNAFGSLATETESAGSLDPSAVDFLFGFTGAYLDPSTGLQNHLHRWYDPALHQWLSEDPIGLDAGDVNTRRYVGNDPVNKVDPTGLFHSYIGSWERWLLEGTILEEPARWGEALAKKTDILRGVIEGGEETYSVMATGKRRGVVYLRADGKPTEAVPKSVPLADRGQALVGLTADRVFGSSIGTSIPYYGFQDLAANLNRGESLPMAYVQALGKNSIGSSTVWKLVESTNGRHYGGALHGELMDADGLRDTYLTAAIEVVTAYFGGRGLVSGARGVPVKTSTSPSSAPAVSPRYSINSQARGPLTNRSGNPLESARLARTQPWGAGEEAAAGNSNGVRLTTAAERQAMQEMVAQREAQQLTAVMADDGVIALAEDGGVIVPKVVDKSWKLKVHGSAQKTGTPGHQFRTYREAIAEAKKSNVESVHLDHGYNRGLDLNAKTITPNRRPDVLSLYDDGSVARIEVQSRTDIPSVLRSRNAALDAQLRANGFTPLPPRVVRPH